jgi:nucleoside phosphorylase
MSRLLIFAASDMEAQPVRRIAGPHELVVTIGGMGPRNAKTNAETALRGSNKPDAVVVVGLCGGLVPSIPEGTIVSYDECVSTEPHLPPVSCSRSIGDVMMGVLTSSSIRCDRVRGITSPRIATTRTERQMLAKTGAAVVDMESYAIATVAAAAGIPVAVLRVVSDSMDRELPDLNSALNESGGLDGRKALKVALRSPVRTVRLLAANKRAMQRLAPALEVALKARL